VAFNLSANVTSTAAVAGAVQFKDGATNLGAPVAVSAGAATLAVNTAAAPLLGGSHSFTAQFVPTDSTVVSGSTSAALPFTIVGAPIPTSITVASSPAAPTTADVVTLTASLTPAAATGTVAFTEGGTPVGSAAVTSGAAAISLTNLTAGSHTYAVAYTPTGGTTFVASNATFTVTVGTFAGYSLNGVSGSGENITATIAAGTLTLTAATTPVNLGTLALNGTGQYFSEAAAKDINEVTVTDTRAGSLGYTVSGIAGDFVAANGIDKINSENLGWSPKIQTPNANVNITAGPVVPAANAIAVGASSTPVAGLKASRTLATAAAGGSVGTVGVSAGLTIKAPTTTKPGVYSTSLVITAI
jgi:hypothetical protein